MKNEELKEKLSKLRKELRIENKKSWRLRQHLTEYLRKQIQFHREYMTWDVIMRDKESYRTHRDIITELEHIITELNKFEDKFKERNKKGKIIDLREGEEQRNEEEGS